MPPTRHPPICHSLPPSVIPSAAEESKAPIPQLLPLWPAERSARMRYTSSAMPHTEPTVNAVLAGILRPMFARATVAGEDTGSVIENPAHSP